MPARTETTTTETAETSDPRTTITALVEAASGVNGQLDGVVTMLCSRDTVLAVATDAVMADEAYESIRALHTIASQALARLERVKELASTIDRLADPLLINDIR